mmetsp:Transcript_116893/g.337819  ORF Transcript_116893/g.337819 Transcript_116893/m.337819 type:complete len:216 (+) Transcript_116893:1778-2425(+)
MPNDFLHDALEIRLLLLQRLGHDLAPLLLEDPLDVLDVHARTLLQQQVRDARGDLVEEVVHGALLQREVHRGAPQAVDGCVLSAHGAHQGETLVALHLVVGELRAVRLHELVELVLHLLHCGISQCIELPAKGVVDDLHVPGGVGAPELLGVALDQGLAFCGHLLLNVLLHQGVTELLQLLGHQDLPHGSELEEVRAAHRERLPDRSCVLVPLRE